MSVVTSTAHRPSQRLLDVYLNDHLAGARVGVDLARRLVRAHRGTAAEGAMRWVAAQIAEDRATLRQLLRTLQVPVSRYRQLGAALAERASRLKPAGRLPGRCELSSVLELETLSLGVQGKAAAWRALRAVAELEPRLDADQLDELLARAQRQQHTLEQLRIRAVDEALVAPRR
jgi:hypothetical protein